MDNYNNYEQAITDWALKYNGYDRIGYAEQLGILLGPLRHESLEANAVPAWIGVDLLRGWAFYVVRSHRFQGHWGSIFDSFPELEMIVEAIRNHPCAKTGDLPPARVA